MRTEKKRLLRIKIFDMQEGNGCWIKLADGFCDDNLINE